MLVPVVEEHTILAEAVGDEFGHRQHLFAMWTRERKCDIEPNSLCRVGHGCRLVLDFHIANANKMGSSAATLI